MDLQKFKFPEVKGIDLAFPTTKTDKKLLSEAMARGFYNGNTPFNKLFSNLFFNGGKIDIRKDIPKDFKESALRYLKSFMGSWEPKHEEKEAICALILSEIANA